jgi:GNAT superfamily N-acetyltransferase
MTYHRGMPSPDDATSILIERADRASVDLAMPLLEVQMKEHDIDTEAMGRGAFRRAVHGLVDTEGRGAVLLARTTTGDVVGVAVLAHTWTIEQGGLCTWLDELYVVPERRAGGIGTALLRRAIEVARADGCLAIDLEVDQNHTRALGLYEREGFRPFARTHLSRRLT